MKSLDNNMAIIQEEEFTCEEKLPEDVLNTSVPMQPTCTDTQQNYSDKNVDESVKNAKSDLIKLENDSNQTKDLQNLTKVSETDSLILSADDELEKEMTMTDKNDKPQNEKSEMENSTCKPLKLSQSVSDDINKIDVNGENDREGALHNGTNLTVVSNTNKVDLSNNSDDNSLNDVKIKSDSTINLKKPDEDNIKKNKVIWMSNISSSAKAADVKQFVSKVGKVVTAKVVTDGKHCYGYIVMNTVEDANECVKTLNNDYFEHHKICVSFTQPCPNASRHKYVDRNKSKLVKKSESQKQSLMKENDTKTSKHVSSSRITKKRSKSTSNSWSGRVSRRRSSVDPLTTTYNHRHSRSRDRRLREERDRLIRRRYLYQKRQQRDEINRRIEKEEKQKAMEYKLEQEHKKLQLERELFEKERRMEREKIEKERLEILRQKVKLTEESSKIQSTSHVKKENFENPSFGRYKAFERDAPPPPKLSSEPKRRSSVYVGAFNGEMVPSQMYKPSKRRASPYSSNFSGIINEPPKLYKQRKYVNKFETRGCTMSNRQQFPERDIRGEDKIINKMPMSNVSSSFQVKKKIEDLDFQSYFKDQSARNYDCSDLKLEGKSERGEAHKIEVIDRKYYVDNRNNGDGSRKHRKAEFEDRKPYSDRKYDFNRDLKRYRSEHYLDRENNPRIQAPTNVNYNEAWKTGLSNPVSTSSAGRFEDNNFSSSYRTAPDFYQSSLSGGVGDYRYDHCQQVTGRKY